MAAKGGARLGVLWHFSLVARREENRVRVRVRVRLGLTEVLIVSGKAMRNSDRGLERTKMRQGERQCIAAQGRR